MEPDFDRHLPQDDRDESHFPLCAVQHDPKEICTCDEEELDMRDAYAEMRMESMRCY